MTEPLFNFSADFGSTYDTTIRQSVLGYDSLFMLALAILSHGLPAEANLLVVGTGTGMEITTFGPHQPQWRFTGVDPSEQMIRVSQERVTQLGFADRVHLHQGVLGSLPESAPFDAATLIMVLHFLPEDADKLALLREIARRLKPGGYLVFVSWFGDPNSVDFQSRTLPILKAMMCLQGMPKARADAIWQTALEQRQLVPESQLWALLNQAGFGSPEPFYRGWHAGGWIARLDTKAWA